MVRRVFWTAIAGAALVASASADARKKVQLPPPPPPAPVIPQVRTGDAAVDAYYFHDRAGAPVWTRDDASRAAAMRVAEILRRAPIDGLAEGPVLAATVQSALAAGTLDDDARISLAWLKYVRAIRAPVAGVEYGDPARMLTAPTAKQVLGAVVAAPSPLAHVDQVASVNAFYSTLRDAALASDSAGDPHVRATLDRLRLVPGTGKVIIVDTANQRLMMVENGNVAGSMKVIVGKLKSPTPGIAGTVHYVTLNPYWNIPMDVVQRRVAPTVIKRGVSYLKAARYVTIDKWGADAQPVDPSSVNWKAVAAGTEKVYLRQLPGVNNMMAHMKFGFANRFDIFLHDTPHRELFAKASRNLSMGCVRLEHAPDLARWLLGTEPATSDDAPEQQVALTVGVPVYTLALTANVDGGRIVYAKDVYGFDQPQSAQSAAVPGGAAADDGS
ncbi:MAG: L,D-transpeptidase family protein [Sphingomicrobium sp.]